MPAAHEFIYLFRWHFLLLFSIFPVNGQFSANKTSYRLSFSVFCSDLYWHIDGIATHVRVRGINMPMLFTLYEHDVCCVRIYHCNLERIRYSYCTVSSKWENKGMSNCLGKKNIKWNEKSMDRACAICVNHFIHFIFGCSFVPGHSSKANRFRNEFMNRRDFKAYVQSLPWIDCIFQIDFFLRCNFPSISKYIVWFQIALLCEK